MKTLTEVGASEPLAVAVVDFARQAVTDAAGELGTRADFDAGMMRLKVIYRAMLVQAAANSATIRAVDQAVALGGLRGLAAGRPRPFRRNLSSACQVSGPTGTASPVPGPRFCGIENPNRWSGPVRVTAPNAPLTAPLPREGSL